jgi:hypothetical protein
MYRVAAPTQSCAERAHAVKGQSREGGPQDLGLGDSRETPGLPDVD